MQDQKRGNRPKTLRLSDAADDRLEVVAEKLSTDRAKVTRALILDGIGLADPITAEIARLVREVAAREFSTAA